MTAGFCPQCGTPVGAGSLFCAKCGRDVSAVLPAMDETMVATDVGAATRQPAPIRSTMRQALRDATLGEYEILDELGRGGMATVFLAHDISLDRKVAIKVMAPHLLEGDGMAERFKLEARTAAQLSHPHIIPIYAVKETAETLFFVMKYIEGRALDEIIRKTGALPIPMVKDILIKVGSALGYAHRREVVHRDVKPGNVMIDDEGTPIVTDFGIAKVAEATGLTMTGTTIGTPSYMSPEQCQAKEVTGASDQYALGVVAFEMLTGKLPFEGDSPVATMYKHVHDPLPPIEDFRPDCPPELVETVSRMLAKNAADRWPTMEAAIRKLGSSTPTGVDPVREELIALARQTGAEELVRQLSDPALAASGGGRPAASPTGAASRASRGGRSRALLGVAATVAVVGVGALAVLQPWKGSEAGSAEPVGDVVDASGAAAGEAERPAEPDIGAGDGGVPATPPAGGSEDRLAQQGGVDDSSGDDAPAGGTTPVGASPGGASAGEPARPAVSQWVVASVSVNGAPASLEVGGEARASARAQDARGRDVPQAVIDGCTDHGWTRCGVQWSSSDSGVLAVDGDGRVRALAPGTATLTATVGGRSGTASLAVTAVAVAEVRVSPGSLALEMGQAGSLTATPVGTGGRVLADREVRWTSSAPNIASVDASGRVRALLQGEATIRASAEAATAEVRLTVRPDVATVVDGVVDRWAAAFAARDLEGLKAVAPIQNDAAASIESILENATEASADMTVRSIEEDGDRAVARIGGEWRWRDRQAGPRTFAPSFLLRLERAAGGWRAVGLEFEG